MGTYISRWMASHSLPIEDQAGAGVVRREPAPVEPPQATMKADNARPTTTPTELKVIAHPTTNGNGGGGVQKIAFINTDAPACPNCGPITRRPGPCDQALNCGAT